MPEAAWNTCILERDLENSGEQDNMGFSGLGCREGSRPDYRYDVLNK
jgi:hypothetical protein